MPKLKANDVGLYLNTGTPSVPVWKLIACLTGNGIDLAVAELNGDSKCGVDREAGDASATASFEGFYLLDPAAEQISGDGLIDLAQSKEKKEWKMANVAETYYRGFTAYISSYNEDAPYNEIVQFTGELNISGTVETAPTT